MASADKKAGRTAAEGLVSSYIHAGSRIGVLLELNCETDFVARNPEFKELLDNFAMQIAASPNVEYVSVDDADQEFLAKEREIEMGKEDLQSKPENIRAQIVEGRMAKLGEEMQVRRFVRYNLGEGIEKKTMNFADEVAEQTQAKPSSSAPKAEAKPAEEEAKPAEDDKPAVAVSAATVKELRGLTGAGMMDCKKALKETGGDVAAAEIFLKKKGMASADKKAGRTAAEGLVSSYIHAGSR